MLPKSVRLSIRSASISGWVVLAVVSLALPHSAPAQTAVSYPGQLTTLYTFALKSGSSDGYMPLAGLVVGDDGNLYGTTSANAAGNGNVFRITPGGDLKFLHSFKCGTDGGSPETALVKGKDGNFYGTTRECYSTKGTAFRITPDGVFTSFGAVPGQGVAPNKLVAASDGNLYGTTLDGFFKLTPTGAMTLLHVFDAATEGLHPTEVVEGRDGAFYGMMKLGGPGRFSYAGDIFRITAEGKVNVLVAFPAPAADGTDDELIYPGAGLVLGSDGNFYGTTTSNGHGSGFFRVTPSGVITRLVRFYAPNEVMGFSDFAPVQASDGNFYGTTRYDGSIYGFGPSDGSVFQITPGGSLTVIYRFPDSMDANSQGGSPSGLVQGPDGALYGTTPYSGTFRGGSGTVFRLAPGSGGGSSSTAPSGTLSNLVAFDPNTDSLRGILPLFKVQFGTAWNPDSSYKALAVPQPNAAGLAADGLTPLVLRVQVPQSGSTVTFSITDSTQDSTCAGQQVCDNGPDMVGALCAIDSPVCDPGGLSRLPGVAAQQVAGSATDKSDAVYMAFAVLQAPLDFVRPSHKQLDEALTSRSITVTASLDGVEQKQTFDLKLVRPPVVLLHGIWSNAATWDWAIQHDQRFTVYAEDYSTQFPNNNAAHFRDNLDKPQEGIAEAVSLLRGKHFAATQADLVGHSMGGLLARLYAAEAHIEDVAPSYYRADNLQSGDIHKLITLDTPHLGSDLANGLFLGDFAITPLGKLVNQWVGCVTCGAAADLQVGNAIVTNMPESKIPSHAIVGVGGETVLHQIDWYSLLVGALPLPFDAAKGIAEVIRAGTEYDSAVFGGDHDLIVSETSQKGGLSGSAVSRFEAQQSLFDCVVDKQAGLPLSDCWIAAHFTVTKENRISARVIELLNASANSSSFGRFPATSALSAH